METEWYVMLGGKQSGPYSIEELLKIEEITPDTLAWRKGMMKWLLIRDIPELKRLFEDKNQLPLIPDPLVPAAETEDLTMSFPQTEPPLFYWFLFLMVLIAYALFQIFS